MPVNPYFQHVSATNEQNLYHDLAKEFVQMSGIDIIWIRSDALGANYDELFGENRLQVLNNATPIEAYLTNFENPYMGDNLYSKFGLHMNESVEIMVAYRRFEEVFGGRPKEGDYFYIPQWDPRGPDDVFRVQFVDNSGKEWQPLGHNFFYVIKAQRAKFSHETYQTGHAAIDGQTSQTGGGAWESTPGTVDNDPNQDNDILQEITTSILDFNEDNPFGNV